MKFNFNLKPTIVPFVKTKYRTIKTSLPHPESIKILDQISKFESSNIKDQLPVIWDKAIDFRIYDKWGNCWIDFTSTIFVANVGHAHPKIAKAIEDLSKKLMHSYSYPTEIRSIYLKKLISFIPSYLQKASLYSTGTEATERAIKLARINGIKKKSDKLIMIGWTGNYHGKTMGSQMMSGNFKDAEWVGYRDPNMFHLPFPYPWVLDELKISGEDLFKKHLDILKNKFNINLKNIAGFMAETFQGWAAVFYPKNYIKALRKWALENDSLLIFDEVQAGFGRCGKIFGYEHYEVEPDLVCCGKGISGGFPLSAVLGRSELIDLDPAYTSTHGGHPLACVAGLKTIEILEEENLIKLSKEKGEIMKNILFSWKKKYNQIIGNIYCEGMIAGVLIKDKSNKNSLQLDIDLCDKIVEKSMQKGVFIIRTGRGSLKFGPPLTIPKEALIEGLKAVEDSILELI